jgi:methionine-S-sulfoxide reductase
MLTNGGRKTAIDKAIFAAGCFWGIQYYFDQVPGVKRTTVGYTGGHTKNPTYDDVHSHTTGHAESVLIEFDPLEVSYDTLLKHFFRIHDPTLVGSDDINIGDEYRSGIFYFGHLQKRIAEDVIKDEQKKYKQPIGTELELAGNFYKAEEYHQKFTERTGIGVCNVPYKVIR